MASELEMLRSYARRCSIALCNLSGGGSELFTKIGEQHYAEPELCRERIEEKMSRMWRRFGVEQSQ
jgi:hypothetical protein